MLTPLSHLLLVSLPEVEGSLSLLRNSKRLAFDLHTTLLVLLENLLVPGNEDFRRDRFAPELGLANLILFLLFFLDHLFDFALSDRLGADLLADVELEGFWHCHAVFTLFAALDSRVTVHVVLCRQTLATQISVLLFRLTAHLLSTSGSFGSVRTFVVHALKVAITVGGVFFIR